MKVYSRLVKAIFLILVLCAAPGASSQVDPEPGGPRIEVSQISDGVYLLTCSTNFTSNCVAVVGDDGLLLVDSGMQPTAELLVAELKKLSDGPVKYLLHTHGHQDHTGANAILGGETTIIAHANFEKGYKTGYGLLAEFPQEAYPDVTFVDEHFLMFNGEKIKMTRMPGGHALDDAIIHFPASEVVCMGGLFTTDNFPYLDFTTGGDIKEYTKIISKIIGMFPDETRFVPSHGTVGTKSDLKRFHDMLLETTAIIQKGLDDGKDVEAMQTEDVLKGWESWAGGFISKDFWIQTVANSLAGNVEPAKKPVFEPLYYTLRTKDAAAAIEQYHELKKSNPDDYDFGEANLNAVGYYLMGKERYDEAIEVLKLNVTLFPESANPYDSLGEAYMKNGNKDLAIKNYKKALEINPEMPSAIQALKQLEAE